jgi:hypothetical protein
MLAVRIAAKIVLIHPERQRLMSESTMRFGYVEKQTSLARHFVRLRKPFDGFLGMTEIECPARLFRDLARRRRWRPWRDRHG